MSRRKYRTLEQIWDTNKDKLFLMVVEAKGLNTQGKALDVFCKVKVGNTSARSKTVKKCTGDAAWGDIFFFDKLGPITVSVSAKSGFGSTFLGEAQVDATLPAEDVVDRVFELVPKKSKDKDKDKDRERERDGGDAAAARVRLRLHHSAMTETRPAHVPENVFLYEQYAGAFKTGDLLVYSGVGLLPALIKTTTNAPYTGLGLVLELPNRWTDEPELYVAELTRNLDRLVDAFADRTSAGVALFRLDERIHQVHAARVFWSPLKTPLEPAAVTALIAFVKRAHAGHEQFIDLRAGEQAEQMVWRFLDQQCRFDLPRDRVDLIELFNAEFVARCLRQGGRAPEGADPARLGPLDVVNFDAYFDPILIRDRRGSASAAAPEPSQQQPQQPLPAPASLPVQPMPIMVAPAPQPQPLPVQAAPLSPQQPPAPPSVHLPPQQGQPPSAYEPPAPPSLAGSTDEPPAEARPAVAAGPAPRASFVPGPSAGADDIVVFGARPNATSVEKEKRWRYSQQIMLNVSQDTRKKVAREDSQLQLLDFLIASAKEHGSAISAAQADAAAASQPADGKH